MVQRRLRWRVGLVVMALLALALGLYALMNARRVQLAGALVARVETPERVVALTFDDGPSPEETREVLRILAQRQAPATFFLIGRDVEAHPEAAHAIVRAGHEVANHSHTHRRMIFTSPGAATAELDRTDRALRAAGHAGPIHFRPPYGKKLLGLPLALARRGTTTIMWDVEPESHRGVAGDAEAIVAHTMARVRPGSIILLHVMRGQDASRAAVGPLVDRLQAEGYRLVTVSALLRHRRDG